jgi:recombination protein RecA
MPKVTTLNRIKDAVNKKLGRNSAAVLASSGEIESEVRNVIPTGISVVDNVLCADLGGLPCGRVTELYGPAGVGKTSFVQQAMAGVQREGGVAIYNDDEKSLDMERIKLFGLNLDDCLVLQPNSAEASITGMVVAINALPDGGPPSLLVWDSIAASVPQKELDGEIGDANIGVKGRLMSQAMRTLVPLAMRKQVALLFVNQIRMKIGVRFGDPEITTGGEALKFAVSLKIRLGSGKPYVVGRTALAKDVPFVVRKSRFSPPGSRVAVRLNFARGWDEVWSTLDYAKHLGLTEKKARGWNAYLGALEALEWEVPWTANEQMASFAEKELDDAKERAKDEDDEDDVDN